MKLTDDSDLPGSSSCSFMSRLSFKRSQLVKTARRAQRYVVTSVRHSCASRPITRNSGAQGPRRRKDDRRTITLTRIISPERRIAVGERRCIYRTSSGDSAKWNLIGRLPRPSTRSPTDERARRALRLRLLTVVPPLPLSFSLFSRPILSLSR